MNREIVDQMMNYSQKPHEIYITTGYQQCENLAEKLQNLNTISHTYTKSSTDNLLKKLTIGRKDYDVFCVALRACYFVIYLSFLFLIYPSHETAVMHPFCCAFASTRFDPMCRTIVFFGTKTHPTSFPVF